MPPESRASRRLFAGASLIVATLVLGLGVRGKAAPYTPEAPSYRMKGPADAPIVISEFSDFQCPACAAAVGPLKKIQILFPGKVRVVYKHFPWDFHKWSKDAAVAAECAGKQGNFWDFHDRLYNSQGQWASMKEREQVRKLFLIYGEGLSLDGTAFSACIDDPGVLASVMEDLTEAKSHWVGSTPTFFINGRRFAGSLQLRTRGLNHIERILKQ